MDEMYDRMLENCEDLCRLKEEDGVFILWETSSIQRIYGVGRGCRGRVFKTGEGAYCCGVLARVSIDVRDLVGGNCPEEEAQ